MALSPSTKRRRFTDAQLSQLESDITIDVLVRAITNTLKHAAKQGTGVTIGDKSGFVPMSLVYHEVGYDCDLPLEITKELLPKAQKVGAGRELYDVFTIHDVTYVRSRST